MGKRKKNLPSRGVGGKNGEVGMKRKKTVDRDIAGESLSMKWVRCDEKGWDGESHEIRNGKVKMKGWIGISEGVES